MTPAQRIVAEHMARAGYGWEDVSVRASITEKDAREIVFGNEQRRHDYAGNEQSQELPGNASLLQGTVPNV